MINVSVNIQRDFDKSLDYIVTPNAVSIAESIGSSYVSGIRSFLIQGSYGTGKSSFIWALQQQLRGRIEYFNMSNSEIDVLEDWVCFNMVGKPDSLVAHFGEMICGDPDAKASEILQGLGAILKDYQKKNKGVFIVLDEFGKHIEYIIRNQLTEEFYFLQQVAELFNTTEFPAFILFTLHQDFLSYIPSGDLQTKNEWLKVSGRYKVLLFNEPLEQLLYFARKRLAEIKIPKAQIPVQKELHRLIKNSGLVDVQNEDDFFEMSKDLYPLDWLSAQVLVSALQKYGQNERSLFLFLELQKKNNGLRSEQPFDLTNVFYYLIDNLSPSIQSADNPHRLQWHAINKALDRVDVFKNRKETYYHEVIKMIGLVNIFSRQGGKLDTAFVTEYFKYTKGIDVSQSLKKIIDNKIIRFFNYRNKLNFIDGTDIDIEHELSVVHKEVTASFNLSSQLTKIIELPTKLAKRVSYEKGTQRFVEFRLFESESDCKELDKKFDGYVFLSFNSKYEKGDLKSISKDLSYPCLFVYYSNSKEIYNVLLLIKKYELVQEKHKGDFAALKIIDQELAHLKIKVNELVFSNMYSSRDARKKSNSWIVQGKEVKITDARKLNEVLSKQMEVFYPNTPIYKNELINRDVLSTPINTARKNLFKRLLSDDIEDEIIGFSADKYPPEKTIFLSLIQENGIHKKGADGRYELTVPDKQSNLFNLWHKTEEILKKSTQAKIPITKFYDDLSSVEGGYKLKLGFLQYWVTLFLIVKKDSYSLYRSGEKFVPYFSHEVYDVLHKNPELFFIQYYEDSEERDALTSIYKTLWDIDSTSNKTFISLYANFLKVIRSQPNYTNKTKSISPVAVGLRDAIINAKSPEEALFEKIPLLVGISIESKGFNSKKDLELFLKLMRDALFEITNAFDELLIDLEKALLEAFGLRIELNFEEYKTQIINTLESINVELLNPKLKVFYKRLVSPLDDRQSWLVSVMDVALDRGKSIKDMLDNERSIIVHNLKGYVSSLIDQIELVEHSNTKTELLNMVKIEYTNVHGDKYKSVLDMSNKPSAKTLELLDEINNLPDVDLNWVFSKIINQKLKNE